MADEMRRFKGSDEKNPFEAMSERFDRAAQLLGLDEDLYKVMRVPSREIRFTSRFEGTLVHIQVSRAFVSSTISRVPGKRRISTHPDVSLDEVKLFRRG